MRVIAGEFKGRRLVAARGLETRPILDRVKESLFSILAQTVVDTRVLDLFCGSGTLGIEALSRGASSAVMVDISRRARICAEKNISALGIADRVEVIGADACRAIRKLAGRGAGFELVFLDPPYFKGFAGPVLAAIRDGKILADGGLIVYRHHKKEAPEKMAEGWRIVRQRRIGDAILTFFELPEAD